MGAFIELQEVFPPMALPALEEDHKMIPLKGRRAEFYFSTESLQHEASPHDSQYDIHRKSSIGSHRLQASLSMHDEVTPDRQAHIEPGMSRPASESNGEVRFLIGQMSDDDELWTSAGLDRRRRWRLFSSTPPKYFPFSALFIEQFQRRKKLSKKSFLNFFFFFWKNSKKIPWSMNPHEDGSENSTFWFI